MPGMSPEVSERTKRPSIIAVLTVVHSLVCGSEPGTIHILVLPAQVPARAMRCSCCGPGVAAAMQACMSASLMPGGGAILSPGLASLPGWAAAGLVSLPGCAAAGVAGAAGALAAGAAGVAAGLDVAGWGCARANGAVSATMVTKER